MAIKYTDNSNNAATSLADLISKSIAPSSDWTAMSGADHFVQFYESDSHLVNSVAEWLTHGLKNGETCIIAATHWHIDAIERAARAFGANIDSAWNNGLYIPFGAQETLAKFMVNGMPDEELFREAVGNTVRAAAKRGRVRAFGEMVTVLVAEGKPEAALKLEELWNDLRGQLSFSLFCAYPIAGVATSGRDNFMTDVCLGHTRVIPTESYTSLTTADERLRAVAFLQQRGRQLEAEIADLERRISSRQDLAADYA